MSTSNNTILSLKNVSLSFGTLDQKIRLNKINMEIKKGEIACIVTDPKQAKVLAKGLIGELKRSGGDMIFDGSIISPWGISRRTNIKRRFTRRVKYVDDSFTSILKPTTQVEKAFEYSLVNPELDKQMKRWEEAQLYKKLFLILGEHLQLEDKEIKLFVDIASVKESEYFERRNYKHYWELQRTYSILKIWRVFQSRKQLLNDRKELIEWAKVCDEEERVLSSVGIYNEKLNLDLSIESESIEKHTDSYNTKMKQARKEKWDALKAVLVLKISFSNDFSIVKQIFYKKRHKSNFKEYFEEFEYHDLEVGDEKESPFEIVKRQIRNLKKKTKQLGDKKLHNKVWKKHKKLFSLNNKEVCLRVKEEIAYYLKQTSKREIEKRNRDKYIEALNLVGLNEKYLDAKTAFLTKGERFQIALALSCASKPDLLIVEDPVKNLDITLRGQLIQKVFEIKNKSDLSVLFLTNDIDVGASLSDYTYIINQYILESGDSKTILTRPIHPETRALVSAINTYDYIKKDVHLEEGNLNFTYGRENIKVGKNHYVFGTTREVENWVNSIDYFEMSEARPYLVKEKNILDVKFNNGS